MFAASIYDNIAFGRPDAPGEDVAAASIRAQAHGFVAKLPSGYNTVLGERGLTLSGGQRLAIARAILKNAPICCWMRRPRRSTPKTRRSSSAAWRN